MKNVFLKIFAFCVVCGVNIVAVSAQNVIKIAAAANLRYSLGEIEKVYESKFKGVDLQINYGASGTFYQQIVNGAPYDIFLSADDILPDKLKAAGITDAKSHIYACGKLALYGLRSDVGEKGFKLLEQPNVGRISVANPRTAPYGTRSVELLKALGLWSNVEKQIVYGDSIAQAAQFAMTGNCALGFVALSLLLNPETKLKGSYYIIPESMYSPIAQSGIVLKKGTAEKFFEFILSPECKAIWDKYGYSTAK
ncbi:MAG: molybdate ABC transporter substrate-binding protein [Rikenellaceae bacterium]